MIEIYFAIVLLSIIFIGGFIQKAREDKQWNSGACIKCNEGFYKSFDMTSDGSVGFSCTNCNYTIWQSYNTR